MPLLTYKTIAKAAKAVVNFIPGVGLVAGGFLELAECAYDAQREQGVDHRLSTLMDRVRQLESGQLELPHDNGNSLSIQEMLQEVYSRVEGVKRYHQFMETLNSEEVIVPNDGETKEYVDLIDGVRLADNGAMKAFLEYQREKGSTTFLPRLFDGQLEAILMDPSLTFPTVEVNPDNPNQALDPEVFNLIQREMNGDIKTSIQQIPPDMLNLMMVTLKHSNRDQQPLAGAKVNDSLIVVPKSSLIGGDGSMIKSYGGLPERVPASDVDIEKLTTQYYDYVSEYARGNPNPDVPILEQKEIYELVKSLSFNAPHEFDKKSIYGFTRKAILKSYQSGKNGFKLDIRRIGGKLNYFLEELQGRSNDDPLKIEIVGNPGRKAFHEGRYLDLIVDSRETGDDCCERMGNSAVYFTGKVGDRFAQNNGHCSYKIGDDVGKEAFVGSKETHIEEVGGSTGPGFLNGTIDCSANVRGRVEYQSALGAISLVLSADYFQDHLAEGAVDSEFHSSKKYPTWFGGESTGCKFYRMNEDSGKTLVDPPR
jgi:hypothetical protein